MAYLEGVDSGEIAADRPVIILVQRSPFKKKWGGSSCPSRPASDDLAYKYFDISVKIDSIRM